MYDDLLGSNTKNDDIKLVKQGFNESDKAGPTPPMPKQPSTPKQPSLKGTGIPTTPQPQPIDPDDDVWDAGESDDEDYATDNHDCGDAECDGGCGDECTCGKLVGTYDHELNLKGVIIWGQKQVAKESL